MIMFIATSERVVSVDWVDEETSLIDLDTRMPTEMIEVRDLTGRTVFVVSVGTLKTIRNGRKSMKGTHAHT